MIKQVEVYKRYEENFKTREKMKNERERERYIQSQKIHHVIKRKAPLVDPLDCKVFSIG